VSCTNSEKECAKPFILTETASQTIIGGLDRFATLRHGRAVREIVRVHCRLGTQPWLKITDHLRMLLSRFRKWYWGGAKARFEGLWRLFPVLFRVAGWKVQ